MFHKFRGVRRGGGRRFRPFAVPLALVLALSAGACSGGSSSDGKIHLTMTWWGSDSRHTTTKKLIALYEKSHPNVVISPTYTGWDDYWDRLATTVAGGNTPDIIQQDFRYVHEYADRGALADLKQYMPSVIDDSQLDKPALSTGQLDGKTYAIPTGVNAFALVVNPKLVKQAGVTLPDDKKWSWDDFVNTAAKITLGSKGAVHGTENMGYYDGGLQVFARQQGEDLFTADGKPGMSPATLTAWFNMIVKMRDTKAEPSASVTHETWSAGIDQSLLATNKGASSFWWTNQLGALSTDAKAPLELLRMPGESQATKPGTFLKPAMFWSLSGRSKHPKDAAQFINFLINDPEAAKLQLSDRGLPINTQLRSQITGELSPADKLSANFVKEITPGLAPPPPLPPKGAGDVEKILSRINEEVLFNRVSVPKAVQEYLDQVKSATS